MNDAKKLFLLLSVLLEGKPGVVLEYYPYTVIDVAESRPKSHITFSGDLIGERGRIMVNQGESRYLLHGVDNGVIDSFASTYEAKLLNFARRFRRHLYPRMAEIVAECAYG